MTPRRHRLFHDHKPPLVAFVLVAVASLGLLVHVAHSEAAPAWLRDRAAVVVSGGSPLTRHVVERTVAGDRAPARVADAPVLAAPPAPVAPSTAGSAAEPSHQPHHAAPPRHDGRSTPDLQPAPPAPTEEPSTPPAYPGLTGDRGADDDGRPEPGFAVRGSRDDHGRGHFWYDDSDSDDRDDHGHFWHDGSDDRDDRDDEDDEDDEGHRHFWSDDSDDSDDRDDHGHEDRDHGLH